ncbi:MAG: PorV/PorQ family protein [Endomicrobiales bacterium]
MKRTVSLIAACMFAFSAVCSASFSGNDAGTAGARFLKMGAGARASAMGDAFTAVADDPSAAYWNPAGLNKVAARSASLMHAAWFEGIFYDWASYVHPTYSLGTYGVSLQYLSYGALKETDETGYQTGTFSPSDLALTLSYAINIGPEPLKLGEKPGLLLGANLKYLQSTIKATARALAFDAGAMYPLLNDRLTVALAVQNAGTPLKFPGGEDPLPLTFRLGGAYRVQANWIASLDAVSPIDNELQYCAGTEYSFPVDLGLMLFARAGYSTATKDVDGTKGFTAGLGCRYLDYTFDYAFVPIGELGTTHRISFGVKF